MNESRERQRSTWTLVKFSIRRATTSVSAVSSTSSVINDDVANRELDMIRGNDEIANGDLDVIHGLSRRCQR
jgi:hypothetical protein